VITIQTVIPFFAERVRGGGRKKKGKEVFSSQFSLDPGAAEIEREKGEKEEGKKVGNGFLHATKSLGDHRDRR